MYLTRVFIPWRLCQNPYNWHKRIWDLFPAESERRNKIKQEKEAIGESIELPSYFLFHVEEFQAGKGLTMLLQSPDKPDCTGNYQLLNGPNVLSYSWLEDSCDVHFILTANPVKMKFADRNRVPHVGELNLVNWLSGKINAFGILSNETLVTPQAPLFFRKGNSAGKINAVKFEGRMTIAATETFKQAAFNGIGPAKAFGCGLLLIKPWSGSGNR
ncbi:MAG: type I-E CRISPR-associated protein Cas6/Cse3/CasE [Chitinispirillaceae bacterium]|nr:type I-E CRISPR-associated protein Cas6/Cse3/CasE [Chitinispirillaceae bacterium]